MNVQWSLVTIPGCTVGGGKMKRCTSARLPTKTKTNVRNGLGAITYNGQRALKWVKGNINSEKYCSTLKEELLPLIQRAYPDNNYTFIQDNAPVHTSAQTRAWLDSKLVNTSVWPAQSPDLYIIENIWRECKIKLRKNLDGCKSCSDLFRRFKIIFYDIHDKTIKELYCSIPRRLKAVIKTKGTLTKY